MPAGMESLASNCVAIVQSWFIIGEFVRCLKVLRTDAVYHHAVECPLCFVWCCVCLSLFDVQGGEHKATAKQGGHVNNRRNCAIFGINVVPAPPTYSPQHRSLVSHLLFFHSEFWPNSEVRWLVLTWCPTYRLCPFNSLTAVSLQQSQAL